MKLIFCVECHDIVRLRKEWRQCECQKSFGRYIDDLNAVIGGAAIPLGFENSSFVQAIRERLRVGQGKEFTAFIIPTECDTIDLRKEIEDAKIDRDRD